MQVDDYYGYVRPIRLVDQPDIRDRMRHRRSQKKRRLMKRRTGRSK